MNCKEEIAKAREEIARIEARIKEIEKKETAEWVPKTGEQYYFPAPHDDKGYDFITNDFDDIDNYIISNGLACRTSEEAAYMGKHFTRIAPLLKKAYELQGDWEPKKNDEKVYFIFLWLNEFHCSMYSYSLDANVYFKSRELAQRAIKELGEEKLKKIFGVTE